MPKISKPKIVQDIQKEGQKIVDTVQGKPAPSKKTSAMPLNPITKEVMKKTAGMSGGKEGEKDMQKYLDASDENLGNVNTGGPNKPAADLGQSLADKVKGVTDGLGFGGSTSFDVSNSRLRAVDKELGKLRGPKDPFRSRQLSLVDALQAQAEGKGPSLASMQMRQGVEDSLRAQAAMAASQGGRNPLAAMRQANQQAAQARAELAGQTAQLRMKEQQGAREQLASALNQGRTSDINIVGQEGDMAKTEYQGGIDLEKLKYMDEDSRRKALAMVLGGGMGAAAKIFGG